MGARPPLPAGLPVLNADALPGLAGSSSLFSATAAPGPAPPSRRSSPPAGIGPGVEPGAAAGAVRGDERPLLSPRQRKRIASQQDGGSDSRRQVDHRPRNRTGARWGTTAVSERLGLVRPGLGWPCPSKSVTNCASRCWRGARVRPVRALARRARVRAERDKSVTCLPLGWYAYRSQYPRNMGPPVRLGWRRGGVGSPVRGLA